MTQRLFFDWVDLQSGGRAVSQAIKFSALIDSNEAESRLPGMDVAMPRAEVTVHSTLRFRFPPAGFVQFLRLLEDLQFFHGSPLRRQYTPGGLEAEESHRYG